RNQQPLRAQYPVSLRKALGKIGLGRKMFKEVTAKYHARRLRGQGPRLGGLLREHGNIRGGFIASGGVRVQGILVRGCNAIYEFAVSRANINNGIRGLY